MLHTLLHFLHGTDLILLFLQCMAFMVLVLREDLPHFVLFTTRFLGYGLKLLGKLQVLRLKIGFFLF